MTEPLTPPAKADIRPLKSWSPVWVIPMVTLLMGAWILFYHYSTLGPEITLITSNAEGIEEGKTKIKSRSVEIGVVESVTLDAPKNRVIIKARLNNDMKDLLRVDSAFWIVKPTIGREGVTGLGTLLSGAFIELQPGVNQKKHHEFTLLETPPLASPDAQGIRVTLVSKRAGQLNPGDPVLFRGYPVGSVETSTLDVEQRDMRYQLFINAPYDKLINANVRFWKDSGITLDMSSQGIQLAMGSVATLLNGGISFDLPEGWVPGTAITEETEFYLFDNQSSIQASLYTTYQEFILFFSDSVRGLLPGAAVEFRGIRLGTVIKVPFYTEGLEQQLDNHSRIPVLIHIEPERFLKEDSPPFDVQDALQKAMNQGLRAGLKSGSLLTGTLYIDLDFVPNEGRYTGPKHVAGYHIIPTSSSGLAQIQHKIIAVLDKLTDMPIEPMLTQTTQTLKEASLMLTELNSLMASDEFQTLPQGVQHTLNETNRTLQGLQPGSAAYNKMLDNMQRLDQALREIQPLLRTLNTKSNALLFDASPNSDIEPKGVQQ